MNVHQGSRSGYEYDVYLALIFGKILTNLPVDDFLTIGPKKGDNNFR
jgi:hypothetical protein